MKKLFTSLVFMMCFGLVAFAQNPKIDQPAAKDIVGGEGVNISEYPYQVALYKKYKQRGQDVYYQVCGGTIINQEWILTAAHCVNRTKASDWAILAGKTFLSSATVADLTFVSGLEVYPGYRDVTSGKDCALMRLSTPLDLSDPNMATIQWVTPAEEAAGYTDAGLASVTSGWGTLSSGGSSPDQLQAVAVPIVSNADAAAAYGSRNITDDQLAAGIVGVGGKDACQGDSGGPLVVEVGNVVKVAGITSWGNGCALPDYPGMYGRVSSFDSWISGFVSQPASSVPAPSLFSSASSSTMFASTSLEGTESRTVNGPIEGINVVPNPVVGSEARVSFFAGSFGADLTINVTDISGRVVMTQAWSSARGNIEFKLNTAGMEKGIYLVQLQGDDRNEVQKIIVK